jgi:serine/threonine-protein kinase HipA
MTRDPVWLWLPGHVQPVYAADYTHDPNRGRGTWQFREEYLRMPGAFTPDPLALPFNTRAHDVLVQGGWAGVLVDAAPGYFGRKMMRERLARELSEWEVMTEISCHGSGVVMLGQLTAERLAPPISMSELVVAAQKILSGEAPPAASADLLSALRLQPTTGGAKPKLDLLDEEGHPSLLKFPDVGDVASLPRVEAATLALARECHIEAPTPRVVALEGSNGKREGLLLRRFDRVATPAGVEHLAYASGFTILGLSTGNEDKASYTALAHELMRWCARGADRTHGEGQKRELWRRLCFNALVGNTDDHARNVAVIRRGEVWGLSPAFDLTPFGRGPQERCALRLPYDRTGKLQAATPAALIEAARVYGWRTDEAAAALQQMAHTCWRSPKTDHHCSLKIDQGWRPAADAAGVV